jgi:D-glycerate 3-kinase
MTKVKKTAGYAADFVQTVLSAALQASPRCPVFGIVGLQGTGKSTLSAQVAALGKAQGLNVVVLSIDDFYLGRRERLQLGRDVHPLLATRGAPGSHDVLLACECIDALRRLRKGGAVRIPVFDKISDKRLPPSRWRIVSRPVDLIIFEGWFLHVPAQKPSELRQPINALERDEDANGAWRSYCNAALHAYAPLWKRIHRTWFLQGPNFDVVKQWRWQQEQTLQKKNPTRKTMTRAQVLRFIEFFERVSRHALKTLPRIVDKTIRLDAKRKMKS